MQDATLSSLTDLNYRPHSDRFLPSTLPLYHLRTLQYPQS